MILLLTGDPFISVIIPTFNSEATLGACLETVVNQSFVSKEVIIIDGQSKDNTIQIAGQYSSKYPFIRWISEKDDGVWDAMNKGIAMSKGKWLFFLGSDDSLYDDNVFNQVVETIKRSNAQHVVYGNSKIIGDTGWANDEVYDGVFDLSKILVKNICHQSMFYNRVVFKEVGLYDKKYTIAADWVMNLQCFARYKFVYMDQIISFFHAAGISTNRKDYQIAKDFYKIIFKYFSRQLFKPVFANYRNEFIKYAKYFLFRGDLIKAFQLVLLRIWHQKPFLTNSD